MTPHETIPLFGSLWWWANALTFATGTGIIAVARKFPRQQESTAKIVGIILLARWILLRPYLIWLETAAGQSVGTMGSQESTYPHESL